MSEHRRDTPVAAADPPAPPGHPVEGPGEEDQANATVDPHPDDDDDFEGDDGGRESQEALLENPGH